MHLPQGKEINKMSESLQEKQEYLRENILEKGYDANLFANYLISKKGDDGADISSWSMEDLRQVVQEFIEKQTSFLSGGENIITQEQSPNENIEEQNQPKEIKSEHQNESQTDSQNQQKENLNQKKINPVIYGIISPESLPCKKVENTPLSSVENPLIIVNSPRKKRRRYFF